MLFLLVFCFCKVCFGQRSEEFQKFLTDSIYKSDNADYVYLYFTKGRAMLKVLQYSTKKGVNTLTFNYGDSVFVDRAIYNPNLFEIIDKNLISLKKYQESIMYGNGEKDFVKKFNDTNKVFVQLGIRYENLFYNHFLRSTLEEIEKTRNKKRKKGMQIINQLYAILEEAEKK